MKRPVAVLLLVSTWATTLYLAPVLLLETYDTDPSLLATLAIVTVAAGLVSTALRARALGTLRLVPTVAWPVTVLAAIVGIHMVWVDAGGTTYEKLGLSLSVVAIACGCACAVSLHRLAPGRTWVRALPYASLGGLACLWLASIWLEHEPGTLERVLLWGTVLTLAAWVTTLVASTTSAE
jgi:hypothetical protein